MPEYDYEKMKEEAAQYIKFEKDKKNRIAYITFDRPDAQNATSLGMRQLYADLIQSPVEAIRKIYDKTGMEFTEAMAQRIRDYLAAKPQGKFGKHKYGIAEAEEAAERRKLFSRYQSYFDVPNEI